MRNQQALSADDEAALAAETLIKSQQGLPTSRKEAEGGFTSEAGGTLIDAGQKGTETMKSQKVGSAMTSEPHGDKGETVTGTAITDEPGRQAAGGGSGGSLDESADDMARKRKSGQVGVGGGLATKQTLSEDGDAKTRARKAGKVGIGKSDDADEDDEAEKGVRLSPDEAEKACGMKKAGQAQFTPQQTKIKGGPFGKSDDEDKDDEEGEEEEEEEKSLDVGDLMKSLDTLEAIAEGADLAAPRDRLAELAEGLAAGTLSKSDYQELHDLTKAQVEPEEEIQEEVAEEPMAKSYQEQFAEDPTMAEGYDVSPFLERQNQLLAASLDQIQDSLLKAISPERQRAFNSTLAKSLRGMVQLSQQQGELIKSLAGRLEQVENTPLPRRGVSNVRTLQKSMAGEVGDAQGPSKGQVMDALVAMAQKSERAPSGEPLMRAVAMLEAGGEISKSLMRDVRDWMQKNNG